MLIFILFWLRAHTHTAFILFQPFLLSQCHNLHNEKYYLKQKSCMVFLVAVDYGCADARWKTSIVGNPTLNVSVELVGQHCKYTNLFLAMTADLCFLEKDIH